MSSDNPTLHRMLQRQLRKVTAEDGTVDLDALINLVSSAYTERENTVKLNERAMHLMSEEMTGQYNELNLHKNRLQELVENQTQKIIEESEKNRLLRKISEIANLLQDTNEVIRQSIQKICLFTGWHVGHCYVFNSQDDKFHSLSVWSDGAMELYPDYVKTSEKMTFEPGQGMPGEVVSSGRAVWIKNVQLHDNFLRKAAAAQSHLKGAIGFPIFIGKSIVGVLEFFSETEVVEDKAISLLMENVGTQIGRAIERKNQEASLRDAKNIADHANALKSEFLANMSHELRTPMHAIISFSRQGIRHINSWPLEEHEENLLLIQESGERLLTLLNALLDLSKLEVSTVDYDMKEYDIRDIASRAIRQTESLAKEKNLTITLTAEDNLPLLTCDAAKIAQVMVNLFANAVKFSSKDKEIYAAIGLLPEHTESLLITVEDQGIGIPEDELEEIFDKFVQSSKTKSGAGGTGLGLAICKEIISGHHGKIWAENTPTQGARLSILLPLHQRGDGA